MSRVLNFASNNEATKNALFDSLKVESEVMLSICDISREKKAISETLVPTKANNTVSFIM